MAVRATPAGVGIDAATWDRKVARQFVGARCGLRRSRATWLRHPHRPGFAGKRPKERLPKADGAKRVAVIEQYAAVPAEAQGTGAKISFADEAHFRADADLHEQWVRKGQPALVDSPCPRWGEKAGHCAALCLAAGETEYPELAGASSAAAGAAFLQRRRASHAEPRSVMWGDGPARGGAAMRAYLEAPDLGARISRLPAYRPDLNADEAIRAWVRAEVTATTRPGTKAAVQEQVGHFSDGLRSRAEEAKTRGRTTVQARAAAAQEELGADHVAPTRASV